MMQQVYRTIKGARLLMCAPQNYSADLLFKALAAAGISNQFMIRLNDPRIPPAQVSSLFPTQGALQSVCRVAQCTATQETLKLPICRVTQCKAGCKHDMSL